MPAARTWQTPLACLCARLEGATDDRARAHLAWAKPDDFHRVADLRDRAAIPEALVAAHAAFGSAGRRVDLDEDDLAVAVVIEADAIVVTVF